MVIRNVTIQMMNYLRWFKRFVKMFFHYKTVFKDIFRTYLNSFISIFVNIHSTFPSIVVFSYILTFFKFSFRIMSFAFVHFANFLFRFFRMFFTFKKRITFERNVITNSRTVFASSSFNVSRSNIKRIIANKAFFNHRVLQFACIISYFLIIVNSPCFAFDSSDYEYIELNVFTSNLDATVKESSVIGKINTIDALYLNLDGETINVTNGTFNLSTTGQATVDTLNVVGTATIDTLVASSITSTGIITASTFTDSTLSIGNGNITGASAITASGAITGGTLATNSLEISNLTMSAFLLTPSTLPTTAFQIANKEYVDTLTGGLNFDFFLNDTASGAPIGTYFIMDPTETGDVESTFGPDTITNDDFTIDSFATVVGEPTFTNLSTGVYTFHFHGSTTTGASTDTIKIFYKLYVRDTAPTETLIITSEDSNVLTSSSASYLVHGTLGSDVTLASNERLVLKIQANIDTDRSQDSDTSIFAEGDTATRLEVRTTIAATDDRYVLKAGDTMPTGGLVIAGNTRIGSTAAPTVALDVTGDILSSGTMTGGNLHISGNVGIGTTGPLGQLHIQDGSTGTTPYAYADNFVIESTNADGGGMTILTNNDDIGRILFGDSDSNNRGQINFDHSDNHFEFNIDTVEKMVIDSNGNVGIGTTSPLYKLDVVGGIRVTGTANTGALIVTGTLTTDGLLVNNDATIVGDLTVENVIISGTQVQGNLTIQDGSWLGIGSTDPRIQFTLTDIGILGGSFGIGTTAPSEKLQVVGNVLATSLTGTSLVISGNITDDTNTLTVANAKTAYDHSQNNTQAHTDYLLNSGADSTSGILTAAGFITTGTSTTTTLQIIDANSRIAEDGSSNMTFFDGVTGLKTLAELSAAGTASGWTDLDPNVALTDSTDFVGIGTTAPAYKVDIVGGLQATGTVVTGALTVTGLATADTLTDGTLTITGGVIALAGNITSTGIITGDTLTDGTISIGNGNLTGATALTASGIISGGTLTDGTLESSGGSIGSGVSGTFSGQISGGTLTDGTLLIQSGIITSANSITTGALVISTAGSNIVPGLAVPLSFTAFDPNALYTKDTQIGLITNNEALLDITKVEIELDAVTNDIDADLMFADNFIGLGNSVVMQALDTSGGTMVTTNLTIGSVPPNKGVYIQWNAEPSSDITQGIFKIKADYR